MFKINRISRINKKFFISVFLLIFMLIQPLHSSSILASNTKGRDKVILLVLDRFTTEDLNNSKLKNIQKLIKNGSISLMNTNTAGYKTPENTFTTLGAGSKALGNDYSYYAFNANELIGGQTASELFKTTTNLNANNYNVIFPYINNISSINVSSSDNRKIGALGDILHNAGLKTAVIGNADIIDTLNYLDSKNPIFIPKRAFVNALSDSKGIVDYGNISTNLLIKDSSFPYGIKPDNKKLLENFKEYYKKANVIELYMGELEKLQTLSGLIPDTKYQNCRQKALEYNDMLIGNVIRHTSKNDLVIFISPTPSLLSLRKNELMTPVIFCGNTYKNGILTSETTHRNGIITNNDVSTSILAFFNLNKEMSFIGQNVQKSTTVNNLNTVNNKLNFINNLNSQILLNFVQRTPILSKFALLISICFILISLFLILKNKFNFDIFLNLRIRKTIKFISIFIVLLPMSMLLLPILKPHSLVNSYLYLIVLTFIFTLLLYFVKDLINVFIIFSLLISGTILIDLFTGSTLLQNSPLGYDPQMGGRFFGLGNEVMCILINTIILLTTLIISKTYKTQQKSTKKAALLKAASIFIYMFIIFVLTYPGLGTKAGGVITSIAAFGFVTLKLLDKKIKLKHIIIIFSGIVIFMLLLMFIDMSHKGGAQSHIGRTAILVRQGGAIQIWYIIRRKVIANFNLFIHSFWSLVLYTSAIMFSVLYYFEKNNIVEIFNKNKYLQIGFSGCIVSCLVALFFNDSGVVATATGIIYPSSLLLNLLLKNDANSVSKTASSSIRKNIN